MHWWNLLLKMSWWDKFLDLPWWVYIIIILVVLFILGGIFSEDEEKKPKQPKTTVKKTKKTEGNGTNEHGQHLIELNEQYSIINEKVRIINELQKENERLSSELTKSKEMNLRAHRLLDQYIERAAIDSSRNAELEQIKTSLEKVVKDEEFFMTTTADLHFMRHNVRNFLIEKQLQLEDILQLIEMQNQVLKDPKLDATDDVKEMKGELKCYCDVLGNLIYHPEISLEHEIALFKNFLKAYGVKLDHCLIREQKVDRSNYYYFTPVLPTGFTLNLLENAIRYGDKNAPDFLRVEFQLQNDEFVMTMASKMTSKQMAEDKFEHGKGIENLKHRLGTRRLKYNLKPEQADPYYYSTLQIKFL